MYTKKQNLLQVSFQALIGAVLVTLAIVVFVQNPHDVSAANGQNGAQQVTLNPGGGIQTNGSDGLRFTINSAAGGSSYDSAVAGQDGVVYRATRQYCCGAGAPMLNIGGTLYGQSGPAYSTGANWTTLSITSTSGATSTGTRTASTGNSAATVRYTAVKNGLTYIMDRTVTYTYPNDYVTDTYTFTIPDGNSENVKFYLGGDTAPGSSDSGYGIMLTSPVRSVISLNTSSQIMFGFREISGSKIFDGATSQSYSAPYATVSSGGNIGYVVVASNHDAGLMAQWNLGSTPGTQTASLEQFATQQGTNLNATLATTSAELDTPVQMNISVVNTVLTSAGSLGYTFTLPNNLVLGSGTKTNGCGGTMTANTGGSTVTLSGGSVAGGSNCVISVPVQSAVAGTYTVSSASVSGLSGLTNNVGTSTLTLTNDNDDDGVTNATENAAPNSGDGDDDGTDDSTQDNVTSIVNPVTGEYSTLTVDSSCSLSSTQLRRASDLGSDNSYTYPLGLLDFTANCGTPGFTTTVTQYFYDPPTQDFTLRKFVNGSYQTVSVANISTQTIGGRSVLVVSYQVTDGGALDDDGIANGIIVDPAGPAVFSPSGSSAASSAGAPNTGIQQQNSILLYASAAISGLALLINRLMFTRNQLRLKTSRK